jgi:hypothetical protein
MASMRICHPAEGGVAFVASRRIVLAGGGPTARIDFESQVPYSNLARLSFAGQPIFTSMLANPEAAR